MKGNGTRGEGNLVLYIRSLFVKPGFADDKEKKLHVIFSLLCVSFGSRSFTTMHLYNLTLQPPSAVTQAIAGSFSGARHQEIIVSHGTQLELLRVDSHTSKLTTIIATDVFASIRSLAAFRLTGNNKKGWFSS